MNTRAWVYVVAVFVVVAGLFGGFFALYRAERQHGATTLGVPPTGFNLEVLHAQRRGCDSCHGDDLASVVQELPKSGFHPDFEGIAHPYIRTSYGIPFTLDDCLMCHAAGAQLPFAPYIHGIHLESGAFGNMGGSCDSCHAVIYKNGEYELVLWDRQAKSELINGLTVSEKPPSLEP